MTADTRDSFRFSHAIPVRFGDLDPLGHVNHLAYLEILETARIAYYYRVMGLQSVREIRFVLAELRIRYLASATLGQTLRVDFRLDWLKRSSSGFSFELRDQATNQLLAAGDGAQVYMDLAANRSEPLPDRYATCVRGFEGIG